MLTKLKTYYNQTPEVRAGFKMGLILAAGLTIQLVAHLALKYFTAEQVLTGFGILVIAALAVSVYRLLVATERDRQKI